MCLGVFSNCHILFYNIYGLKQKKLIMSHHSVGWIFCPVPLLGSPGVTCVPSFSWLITRSWMFQECLTHVSGDWGWLMSDPSLHTVSVFREDKRRSHKASWCPPQNLYKITPTGQSVSQGQTKVKGWEKSLLLARGCKELEVNFNPPNCDSWIWDQVLKGFYSVIWTSIRI